MLAWMMPLAAVAAITMSGNSMAQGSAHCSGDGKCRVQVRVDQGKPCTDAANIQVRPETVEMGRNGSRTIVWRLEAPFEFCPANGDGIKFKSADLDFQFFGSGATDSDDGDDDASPGGRCRQNFRWKNKNEPHTRGKTYSYLIRFTGPNGQVCIKDPFVRNG